MGKAKSKVSVHVADATGGMTPVEDHRFLQTWPLSFDVPLAEVDNWLVYLSAEGERMGWTSVGIEQLDSRENSGSITFSDSAGRAQVDVVWEKSRDSKPMKVRAGASKGASIASDEVAAFIERARANSAARRTQRYFRVWHLAYTGLPWKGELWLADNILLSPPSLQYEEALTGPRIVLVAVELDAISQSHAQSTFELLQRELAVFLSVVVGKHFEASPNGGWAWTWAVDANGKPIPEVRSLGYWETVMPSAMPSRGTHHDVPLLLIARPEFERRAIGESDEVSLPTDICSLWEKFANLPPLKRRQFLQVGSMWQAALSVWAKHETMRFALNVAACEALKPLDSQFKEHNIYDVVETLLGKDRVDALKKLRLKPHDVRNAYLHVGQLRGSEFVRHSFDSSFKDPSFDEAGDLVFMTTKAAIIAWLMRDGEAGFQRKNRPVSKPWLNRKNLIPGLIVLSIGVVLGAALARGAR